MEIPEQRPKGLVGLFPGGVNRLREGAAVALRGERRFRECAGRLDLLVAGVVRGEDLRGDGTVQVRVYVSRSCTAPVAAASVSSKVPTLNGLSSFEIVPTPGLLAMTALTGASRLTTNVSFGSNALSPITVTAMVFDVWPGLRIRVPDLGK